jgi:hypothetical protein
LLYPTNLEERHHVAALGHVYLSLGSVHLKLLDSFDDPVIDPNIFSL